MQDKFKRFMKAVLFYIDFLYVDKEINKDFSAEKPLIRKM